VLKALVTDVDGTITDMRRRISTDAIERIRTLIDGGIDVVIASGNTACFMDGLCKMMGTNGIIIGENGGIYRNTFAGTLHVNGDRSIAWNAFNAIKEHFGEKGIELELYSPNYRFADVAFARTVDVAEVRDIVKDHPIKVLDTGFAVHLLQTGIDKGVALKKLVGEMGIDLSECMAIGDSMNDTEMIACAGVGVAVGNAHPEAKAAAVCVTEKSYGDGFVEAVEKYYSDFFKR